MRRAIVCLIVLSCWTAVPGAERDTADIVDRHNADAPRTEQTPAKRGMGRGFHRALVRVGAFAHFGQMGGGVFDRERRVLRAYEADLITAYVDPHRYEVLNTFMSGGVYLDLMAPAWEFGGRGRYSLTGVKLGARARYGFMTVDSSLMKRTYERIDIYRQKFEGNLLTYHFVTGGPVVNLIFGGPASFINLLITAYGTVGPLVTGQLAPVPGLRAARLLAMRMLNIGGAGPAYLFSTDPSAVVLHGRRFNLTSAGGYTARMGLGPEVLINGYVPVTVGIHATYAYTALALGRAPVVYADAQRRMAHHEWGGEASLAFHW